MGVLIGMDEAGYGPNFGPLVVAGTAWEVPEEGSGFRVQDARDESTDAPKLDGEVASATVRNGTALAQLSSPHSTLHTPHPEIDLYRLLRNIVSKSASERRIAIADSKSLYHPGLGLRQLERGVHAVLLAARQSAGCWSAIVDCCGADPDGQHQLACWPDGFDCVLPVDTTSDELSRLAARLARACDGVRVRPLAIRARLVYPQQFNELVAYHGSKGGALSHITIGLLREMMDCLCPPAEAELQSASGNGVQPPAPRPQPPVYAVCDKHGARNFYTALLQHHFAEHWVQPVFESHAESRYAWGQPESRFRVTFRMKGEKFMPTALASMTAKYLRELAMRAFNGFWSTHVPGIRPTAGYPADSHRFRKAIAAKQRELKIDDHVLWRNR